MTISQLKYFLAVCEFGKLRITSEQLHVSEPTISVSIKRLEEEVGSPLFIRDRKQLILTVEGQLLREKAAEVVESFDRLEREIQEMQQSRKTAPVVRLGAPPTQGEHLCSRLVAEFMKIHPHVRFEIPTLSSFDGTRQVEEEKLELAISNQLAVTSDRLAFSPIIRSSLLGYVRDDHPLAGQTDVTPKMLKNEKLILISETSMTAREVLRWFRDAGVEPNLFMYSHRTNFTISMIKESNALAFFLDDPMVVKATAVPFPPEGISPFTLAPPITLTFGIVRRRDAKLSKEANRFYEFCSHYQFEQRKESGTAPEKNM